MSNDNPRDYGLPDSDVTGTPTWTEAVGSPPCPNCGGKLCEVKVAVTQALLRGNHGMSNYLGCPACPFASPALVVAHVPGTKGPVGTDADHRFWARAAAEGLIDGVGGAEWRRRFAEGDEKLSDEWIAEHERNWGKK